MMKNKKGQAAMEFLMTYGWAILVVLAAIAALAYFGVLSPDKFLPNKCNFPSGFGCVDFVGSAATDDITLVMQNGAGFDATITGFTITGCTDATPAFTTTSPAGPALSGNLWTNGQKIYINMECTEDLIVKEKFQGDSNMAYTTTNGLPKTSNGDIVLKIDP